MFPIWPGTDPVLVAEQASVWWLDLTSPFGPSPAGIDWTIELPDGVSVLPLEQRPRFGVGPDAHRPHVIRHPGRLEISVPGPLPGHHDRRPMTHPDTWCDLYLPVVVIGDQVLHQAPLRITRRAMGDSVSHEATLEVVSNPGAAAATGIRRALQVSLLPWFAPEEQRALAATLARCAITDCSLNWFDHGIPAVPPAAYADSAANLRQEIPGVHIWIGGQPGAGTLAARANDSYQRPIGQLASPEAMLTTSSELVIAAERTWCDTIGADGVMLLIDEPSTIDTAAVPAHCFSRASRTRFAREAGLESIPEPLAILRHHREAWAAFCCRQVRRVIEVARNGHDGRPLALCALGPGGTAREEASADWRELGEVADILIYAHQTQAQPAPNRQHWGYTRLGGMPQSWWEEWHDPLGTGIPTDLAVADAKMQVALSGGAGLRIGSWAHCDGHLQYALQTWS